MKVYSFFRLLNQKIKQYEKVASNPYEAKPKPITIVWVEDLVEQNGNQKR